MPGLALEGLLLVMPLANIVLLGRDLLTDQVTVGAAVAVVGSTALYAAAAIGLASRIFGAESVLYSSSSGWHDLWRRSSGRRLAPSLTAAVVTVAVIFPLFFLLQGIGQFLPGLLPRLQLGSVITGLAFGVIPALVCWFARVDIRRWYALAGPARSPLVWLGAAALGLSLWVPDHELIVAVARFRGVDFAGLLERLTSYAGDLRQIPVGWIVGLIAVVPAVFEEFFFRGFLWAAIEQRDQTSGSEGRGNDSRARSGTAWWVTSLVFGAFHLIMPNPLALERLVATTAMGFALGWVRRRTGSVFPGTLLHALHNASATLISYYSTRLAGAGLGQDPTTHLPTMWLLASAVLICVGLFCVGQGTGRDSESDDNASRLDDAVAPDPTRMG
jgi:ABC-2 type transport system permease protein/sodium transport system permease protein